MKAESHVISSIIDRVSETVVGDRVVVEKLLAGALANGHILFEDNPGLGKTLLVKVFARAIGFHATRIQFTPDLLPSDILGTHVWDPEKRALRLARGPIFTNVLLADEINRAPPKTQSALLEAMQERQVTLDGETLPLEGVFFVLATQNPIEQEGTYALPEAQLDRFLLRLTTGYPRDIADESKILARRLEWQRDDPTGLVEPVLPPEGFQLLQEIVERGIHVAPEILDYISGIVRALRDSPDVAVGPSPRGAVALMRASRGLAFVRGRDFVTPDDVKELAVDALAHRTLLDLERALEGLRPEDAVRQVADAVPVPVRFAKPTVAAASPA
ncbi:MAG: AAA family ATPase [Thermoplasmatota archaeon]